MNNQLHFTEGEKFYEPGFDVESFVDHYDADHSFIDELAVFDGL